MLWFDDELGYTATAKPATYAHICCGLMMN